MWKPTFNPPAVPPPPPAPSLVHSSEQPVSLCSYPPNAPHQHFSVLVAEGRPEGAGFQAAEALARKGVPVTVVLDSAVGYHMEVADLCVTGAEGVLENGGIINKVRVDHRGVFL